MKTASIITMHCPLNYGAVLQTYALQKYLQSLKLSVSVIDYTPSYIVEKQSLMYVGNPKFTQNILLRWLYRFIKAYVKIRRLKIFSDFRNRELQMTKRCNSYEEIVSQKFQFDYCFCGSDQIWNDNNKSGVDPSYYLQFAKGKSVLISYAASGNMQLPLKKKVKEISIPMINELDFISMREDVTIANIQPYITKPITHVCDPVFLLSKNEWIKLSEKMETFKIQEHYVLVYPMSADAEHVISNAYKVAKHYRLPLYCISTSQKRDKRVKRYFDVSPYEFLRLFSKADFIVTNSFHGTAFSIIMNKIFWSCEVAWANQRILSLLNKLDLSNRSIPFDKEIDPSLIKMDYKDINQKLHCFVQISKNFIDNAIKSQNVYN